MREYAKLSLDLRIKLLATVLDAALAEDETLRSYAAATAVQMAVAADKAGWIAAQIDISRIPETIHTAYQKGINIVHRECVERYLKNIGLLKM